MANPQYRQLTADTEASVDLGTNCGLVEVAIIAGTGTVYFNTTDTAIGPVAGNMDGNHAISATLPAKIVADGTSGASSKVRLRSSGTPTVSVCGL